MISYRGLVQVKMAARLSVGIALTLAYIVCGKKNVISINMCYNTQESGTTIKISKPFLRDTGQTECKCMIHSPSDVDILIRNGKYYLSKGGELECRETIKLSDVQNNYTLCSSHDDSRRSNKNNRLKDLRGTVTLTYKQLAAKSGARSEKNVFFIVSNSQKENLTVTCTSGIHVPDSTIPPPGVTALNKKTGIPPAKHRALLVIAIVVPVVAVCVLVVVVILILCFLRRRGPSFSGITTYNQTKNLDSNQSPEITPRNGPPLVTESGATYEGPLIRLDSDSYTYSEVNEANMNATVMVNNEAYRSYGTD